MMDQKSNASPWLAMPDAQKIAVSETWVQAWFLITRDKSLVVTDESRQLCVAFFNVVTVKLKDRLARGCQGEAEE